jgi:Copper binding proteins, plastocyanin/azurin family
MRRALIICVTGLVAAFGLVASGQATTGTLTGEVGPGFKIEVTRGEKDVKTLRHGTYRIVVEDKASIHNFHLIGPGVNKKTGVGFKGKQTWTVRLKKGRYTYQCDPHAASGMKGSFRVT